MVNKYSLKNLLRFTDRGNSSLATSLLDYLMSHNEVDKQYSLYSLVSFRKEGRLIEAYLEGGLQEVERVALEEMKAFMYHDGKGQRLSDCFQITQTNVENNVVIGVTETASRMQDKDRTVCWKLEHRGMLGESLLHILILCNTDIHSQIAKLLVRLYPTLSQDIIEGEEYYGTSGLHLCIAFGNEELLKLLLESGANVSQRARGTFYHPADQQWPVPRKRTNFEGLSYFGEYPLAWAACCEDESSYNLLLKYGANPQAQDSYGNSLLHVVVVRDKLKMYGYALRHPVRPASDRICNKYGLTPLTLACKLGRNKIFCEMLELSSMEYWRYSNITCSGYPLNALDSIQPNGMTNLNSALMIILNGRKTEHLDMLEGGVIQRLLEEKWKTFAQRCFYRRLIVMMLHLLNLSIAVFLRPSAKEPLLGKTDAVSIVRYCAEIGACIGCVGFAIFQQVQEILAQGFLGFLITLVTSPSKFAFVVSCLLILSCIPCRVIGDRKTEDFLLVFAIPGSWLFLVFFAGAVRLTGPFVTMIYSMLVGDMFRFSIIYLIFMFGFTQAFYFLFKNAPSDKGSLKKRFATLPLTWMGLFQMTLGSYEYEDFREAFYQKLTQTVFAIFMVLTPILLLNMLIAMMGNTYCEVITQSEKEWVKQWAKIIVVLERAIDRKSAKQFIDSYSVKLPPDKDDPETEVRGVLVIKTKKKSKAKEKKQALTLWKHVGKRTIQEVRKAGSAAEVRRKYRLFLSKQVTAQVKMASTEHAQSMKCKSDPIQTKTENGNIPLPSTIMRENGFGELLSQVTSASGIDLGESCPTDQILQEQQNNHTSTHDHQSSLQENTCATQIPPPPYNECASTSYQLPQNNTLPNMNETSGISSKLLNEKSFVPASKEYLSYTSGSLISPLDLHQTQEIKRKPLKETSYMDSDKATEEYAQPKRRKKRKVFKRKSCIEDISQLTTEGSSDEQSICVNVKAKVISRQRRVKTETDKDSSLCKIAEEAEASENQEHYKDLCQVAMNENADETTEILKETKSKRKQKQILAHENKSQQKVFAISGHVVQDMSKLHEIEAWTDTREFKSSVRDA